MPRSRKHKIELDLYDWADEPEIKPHRVTLIIDEERLGDVIAQAINRHDRTKKIANGGIIIKADPIGKEADDARPERTSGS